MSLLLTGWKHLPLGKTLRRIGLWIFNDRFLIGVTGVIFDKKNRILLLKHTYRKNPWSLPGGYLQSQEYPKSGLQREIFEETAFKVKIIRIITTKTDQKGRIDLSYFGEYVSGKFTPSEEVNDYKWVKIDQLPRLIADQYEQIHEAYKRKLLYDARKKEIKRVKTPSTSRLGPYRVQ